MSAAAHTFVKRSEIVGLTPSPCSSTRRSRSSSARPMSTVTPSWKTGACQASVSRRAIVFRIDDSSSISMPSAGALDVLGYDSTFGPGSGDRSELDPALPRDPARERRGLDASVPARGFDLGHLLGRFRRGAPAALPFLFTRARGRAFLLLVLAQLGHGLPRGLRGLIDLLAFLPDGRDRLSDLDRALGDSDLQQDAGCVGLDLLRDLVRVELVERLAFLDLVALGLEPLDDRPGLHPLPEPRQLDLSCHCYGPPCGRSLRARRRREARTTPPSRARTAAA